MRSENTKAAGENSGGPAAPASADASTESSTEQIDRQALEARLRQWRPANAGDDPPVSQAELDRVTAENEAIWAQRAEPGKPTEEIARPIHERRQWLQIGSHAEVARKVIRQHLLGSVVDEGKVWLRSQDGLWHEVDEDRIARWIARWDGVQYQNAEGKARTYKASAEPVIKWIHRFRARPGFFGKAPRGVPFRNCFLDMARRTVRPLRGCRQRWSLPFDYEKDACRKATPVAWLDYLRSIWGDDSESVFLVHEMLAYLLTGRTDLQKIFLLIGAKRGGKGTLLRLIKKIFGDAAGTFNMAKLGETFGAASLLGKTVAYDSDFRRSTSAYKDEAGAVATLLKISGEDDLPIPRKYLSDWTGRLPVRILIGTNPPFALTDVGATFASRLIVLAFPVSFLGREDRELERKLAAELPAIVDLALRSLPGLEKRGGFVEPASSRAEREAIERAQDPMKAFVEECCEIGEACTVQRDALFKAACKWRDDNGHKRMSSNSFGEYLRTHHGIGTYRPNAPGKRDKLYRGIRLLASALRGSESQSTPERFPN